ncbi:MAG: 2,3-bisphosphoglycerate-independent phosphoglycerate mutase, partial [Saprospiraceae bacterium]|nr:2,3-bisphosphoglycerate-independent phosphoglycerate mutase [Saprospiraceae bacterium]
NENGTPNTAHTKNPVPLIFVTTDETPWVVADGKLGDIAPTILHRMGLHVPAEMNGDLLIKS